MHEDSPIPHPPQRVPSSSDNESTAIQQGNKVPACATPRKDNVFLESKQNNKAPRVSPEASGNEESLQQVERKWHKQQVEKGRFATSKPFACLQHVTIKSTLKHQGQGTSPLQQKRTRQLCEGTMKYSRHGIKGTPFCTSMYSQLTCIKQPQPAPAPSNVWSKHLHANCEKIDGQLLQSAADTRSSQDNHPAPPQSPYSGESQPPQLESSSDSCSHASKVPMRRSSRSSTSSTLPLSESL